jgi:hypothetical protein
MAHNLCYTTLIDMDTVKRFELDKEVDYVQTPNNGDLFRALTRPSILKMNIRFVCHESAAEGFAPHYPRGSPLGAKASQSGSQKGNGSVQAGCFGWASTRPQSECDMPLSGPTLHSLVDQCELRVRFHWGNGWKITVSCYIVQCHGIWAADD